MKRRIGVNVLAYASLEMISQSFQQGFDLQEIDKSLYGSGIGMMLLPLRGISKSMQILSEVLCYEDAWNYSDFFPAFLKLLNHDIWYATKGSPSIFPGVSVIDRIGGMNYHPLNGTIFDWLFFGNIRESFDEFQCIRRKFRNALETVHEECDGGTVVEVHPEFRQEICDKYNLTFEQFPNWLAKEFDGNICIDTFHTFARGSRDGKVKIPCINPERRLSFLKIPSVQSKVKEVHFRFTKSEVNLILRGKTMELPVFQEMKYMYQNYSEAIFILEMGPGLFSSIPTATNKVKRIWKELDKNLGQV